MPQQSRISLREQALDICSVSMTGTVIALSVMFFLAFREPVPVVATIAKVNGLSGELVGGSCSFGSIAQTSVFRADNSSVLIVTKIEATILSKLNFTLAELADSMPEFGPTDCRTFDVQRHFVPMMGSSGRYRVSRKPDQRPNELCNRWSFNISGYYWMGFFRGSQDVVENHVVESLEPINPDEPIGITVYSSAFQKVTGPELDLELKVNGVFDFTELIAVKMPEIQFSCQYRPFFDVKSSAFALNVTSILVAILCLFVQLAFFYSKYTLHHTATIKNDSLV
jgi:hypothetical protein